MRNSQFVMLNYAFLIAFMVTRFTTKKCPNTSFPAGFDYRQTRSGRYPVESVKLRSNRPRHSLSPDVNLQRTKTRLYLSNPTTPVRVDI